MEVKKILMLCALASAIKTDDQSNDVTLSVLPHGLQKEVLSFLKKGLVYYFFGCPKDKVRYYTVDLRLYSRANRKIPVLLNQFEPDFYALKPKKRTIMLIPGWLSNATNSKMSQLKDAYLKRYDANVIITDWSKHSVDYYSESFCAVPGIAKILGNFLCKIDASFGVSVDEMHLVGHSMGAQIGGLIGQEVKSLCGKILHRITALDPAGPLYAGLSELRRLDSSDARHVDVIHTNMGVLGYQGRCGTVDFYPNGGKWQPGCFKRSKLSRTTLKGLPISYIICSHQRSVDYMIESVNSNGFLAESCDRSRCSDTVANCNSTSVMGENCPLDLPDNEYVLQVQPQPPFAKSNGTTCNDARKYLNVGDILNQKQLHIIETCPDVQVSDVDILLYNRRNKDNPIHLDNKNINEINPNDKIIVLIHGWLGSIKVYGLLQLKDAYLKRYNCNLIIVDWAKWAWQMYPMSVCVLPKVARVVASYLCTVSKTLNVPLNKVHLVGHSLGGQMTGFIGQHSVAICEQKIGRATGLDPAGPLYQGIPETERLDETDALFVDVIHTNQGELGYWGNCGDVDFYVNCGSLQPGCQDLVSSINKVEFTIVNLLQSPIWCDHFRCMEYMTESVNSDGFKATPCTANCETACLEDAEDVGNAIVMGENCLKNVSKGSYSLSTNWKAPYAKG